MNFLRLFRSAAAFLLAAVLFSSTACASSTRSADVIAAALGEVGNAEGGGFSVVIRLPIEN